MAGLLHQKAALSFLFSLKVLSVLIVWTVQNAVGQVDPICGYAPLCGSADTEFEFVVGDLPIGGQVLGGAEVKFTDCCLLSDTEPVEDCQIVDPSGESIRIATATEPICGKNREKCSQDAADCGKYFFAIKPFFDRASQNSGCCDSCTCYGDPVCNSFDGTQKTWILCDGREIPDDDSIFDMCRITERRCSKELDHAGNQCVYLAQDPRGRDWEVGKLGSPCVPNPASPASTIVMYEVPSKSFKFTLEQGERGIIHHVYLQLSSGTFDLSAEACLKYGNEAWDHSTGNLPPYFSFEDVVRGTDAIWNVIDPNSGIAINIRCHANEFDDVNGIYVPRINVEDLSDPIPNRRNTNGFCVENKFKTGKATTSHTDKIVAGNLCTEGLQESDKRDIFREICKNPALPQSGISSCTYHFCSKNFGPLYNSIEECEATFETSIAEGFCKGVVYVESDVIKCVNQWFELGPIPTIHQYYNDNAGCTTEIQTSLEKCQSGITIQFLRGDTWNDAIAIPNDFCGHDDENGEIRISYCDFPQLFNRIIRVVQKTANIACGPSNQCYRVDGIQAFIALVEDTPYPTVYPTGSPTVYPTEYPSPYPTTLSPLYYPTNYPTGYPSLSPTKNPTYYPTPYPNNLPHYPTVFPTASPLHNEPEYCPQPPLCNTPEGETDIDEGTFHFALDSCCPVSACPTLDYPEQNRSYGSNEPYCQVDGSYTGQPCENNFELEVKVMFSKDEDTECCKTCNCYGDPRCYSFDGKFEEFILCDARTVGESPDDRCVIRKKTCEAQKDHEGHACKWYIPGQPGVVPDYSDDFQQQSHENQFPINKYGSPCRYDVSKSAVPTVLLYKTADYEVAAEHGDRGYINTISLTTITGDFEMTSDRCVAGRDWEIISGTIQPKTFQRLKYGKEYVWKVIDLFTGIELRIRCTGVIRNGAYTSTFINVEAISEPDFDRIKDAEGFCATGVITEKRLASHDLSDYIANNGLCTSWNEDASEIVKRDVMRIILDSPGIAASGVYNAEVDFCNQYFAPGWTIPSKCVSSFVEATSVQDLIHVFCKAVTLEVAACAENLAMDVETSGYSDAFKTAYVQYIVNVNSQCVLSPSELPETLNLGADGCDTGVELQWYNPRTEVWMTYAAFPDNRAPCNGYTVTFKYKNDPQLFKNRLRLLQKHSFAYCSACTYASAVDAWFTFKE